MLTLSQNPKTQIDKHKKIPNKLKKRNNSKQRNREKKLTTYKRK